MSPTVRWMRGAAMGVGATGAVAAAVAVVPSSPWVGLAWGSAVALVAALVAAFGVRWAMAPVRRGAAALVRAIDEADDGDSVHRALPGLGVVDLAPLAAAVGRRLQRHRDELEALRADTAAVALQLATAQRVLEQSRVGLAIVETDEGRILYTNPSFRVLCRLRSDPAGRRPLEVVPAVEIHEAIEAAMVSGAAEADFATGWADLSVRVERLDARHLTVRIDDVSGEKEAERSRSDFVANVSHELRTPITAIMGYAETLLVDAADLPVPVVKMLQTVERNAKRLRDLFEDLLRLHRIETRRKQLPVAHALLQPILVDAVIEAVDQASERGVVFELDVPDDLRGWCNRDALAAMVSNLARNAVAYSRDQGHVVVRAHAVGEGRVDIDVVDDGIGIADVHHERIFERFYRVDEARSRRAGGTGLGLAIVKHFALASGSTVDLTSRHGEGSTFSIHLPKAPPER